MLRNLALALFALVPLQAADAVKFADSGGLKMLYDSRMYPQAVEIGGQAYLVWRGAGGEPWIRSYGLRTREFSEPTMLLDAVRGQVDAERFARDQHYAPVVWADGSGRLHVAFGFHRTPGYHLAAVRPGGIREWERLPPISHSVSYPQVHQISGKRTLVYFREGGHLGFWTYRISDDDGRSWRAPESPVIDMDAPPHASPLAAHAGSYQTTRVGDDGRSLHVAFIWKMENPVRSERYDGVLHDYTRRHNLYYVRVDLETGAVFNARGSRVPRPVNYSVAQARCLVLDTAGGSAAVGPSIALGPAGEPSLLLAVSGETPYASTFNFLRWRGDRWSRAELGRTGHPFNSGKLDILPDGSLRAQLVSGEGEALAPGEMNRYGWGDSVQEWRADADGKSWRLSRGLAPPSGSRYQSVKAVYGSDGRPVEGLLVYYAWSGDGPGRAYLLDERD